MGFSQKIKYFFKEKGLTNRDVSILMDNYSEALISRYINSDNVSMVFLHKLIKYFPEVDVNYLIRDDKEKLITEIASEPITRYNDKNVILLEEIEEKINELKRNLSRN